MGSMAVIQAVALVLLLVSSASTEAHTDVAFQLRALKQFGEMHASSGLT